MSRIRIRRPADPCGREAIRSPVILDTRHARAARSPCNSCPDTPPRGDTVRSLEFFCEHVLQHGLVQCLISYNSQSPSMGCFPPSYPLVAGPDRAAAPCTCSPGRTSVRKHLPAKSARARESPGPPASKWSRSALPKTAIPLSRLDSAGK